MINFRLKFFGVVLSTFLAATSSTLAENLALPENLKWVVLASRETLEEAISFANMYKDDSDGVRVVLAKNGRYAVILGPVKEININKVHARKDLPADAYLAGGKTLAETVWTPSKKAANVKKKSPPVKKRQRAAAEATISKPSPNLSTPDRKSISPR
ncbi:hypothetical protein [Shinella sumterensis]|uniref:Uncharacterized protein n=1 Tax=Shinella sumterensis TaxID=1967501 RepID=A0AA50CQT2_9HYPH|nr:hypothetical protein [Shinella sumterensis]WLR98756.1 hypothetical protein Q9313_06965 [Shinella sumterensis]